MNTQIKLIRQYKIPLILSLIIIIQTIFLSDYIFPLQWGQIKVKGLSCTCPDESVINGQTYLRSITPDSLKKYDLDYSEIYVTEKPSTNYDPMGSDLYMIKGKVIGKDRVSSYDSWNPKVKIESWREIDYFIDLTIKLILIIELLILLILLQKRKDA